MKTRHQWDKEWELLLSENKWLFAGIDMSTTSCLYVLKEYVDGRFDEIREILETEVLPPHE